MVRLLSLFFFSFLTLQSEDLPVKKNSIVILETTMGNIEVTLKPDIAPKACENFTGLVQKHYYDGVQFHRVIKNFMIQGGDPTATGAGGASLWDKPFADECSKEVKFDKPGLLAMANRGPGTNGSQFFITTVATPWLHMKHTIFGEVTAGYEIVKQLEGVKTGAGDRPVSPVKIVKAYLKE
ncbi:MAG: peptidylprolyl isomerase [Verrucomicrobiota bacterium]|nr:peptidylprolyl isomerase [Verrucomicrobiota bacterium]